MDNFKVAIEATETAMKDAGSAARENAAYMESLEAQTIQLKATFQDFANNVIDKELVSSILALANDALGLLNTETGKTITQWGLLTGVLTGGLTIFGQIGAKLIVGGKGILQLGKHLGVLASAFTGASVSATAFAASAAPVAAVIAAAAVAIGLYVKHIKATHQPLSEYTSQIESNNEQLEKNKQRLEEIEKLPWTEKTDKILAEKEALEQQNAELEKNIELNKSRRYDRASEQAVSTVTIEEGSHYTNKLLGIDWKTEQDAIESINRIYGEGTKIAKFYINGLTEVTDTFTAQGEALNTHLINKLQKYNEKIMRGEQLGENEIRWRNNIIEAAKTQAESYQFLQNSGVTLTESQQALIDAFDYLILAESVAKNEMIALNQDGVSALLAKYSQLKSAIEDVNGVSYLNVTALGKVENATVEDKVAMYDLIAAQTVFNNSSLDVSQKLEALEQLAIAAGVTSELIANTGSGSDRYNQALRRLTNAGMTMEEAKAQYASSVWKEWIESIDFSSDAGNNNNDDDKTIPAKIKQVTDAALEQFKSLQKDLNHQKEMGLIKEEEYYDKLEELVKQYKAQATDHMKKYGLTVNQINQNMYQYEEEIYKGRAKLSETLAEQQKKAAEEAAQAQKEALEQQRENFETAINYVIKQIDKEIDKLQELRDQTEQYYDDKIDALNDANDELERQIQYEELLNNLTQAKDKQLYVFQNGQFQYAQDVEAIASAQAELDAYERNEALRKEVENLETLKDQALASIDKQIEGWEEYKEEWSGLVDQYQDEQDRLIAEQVLGIDLEQENWNTRLANLQSFVDQYNSILSQLNSGVSAGSGVGGGSSWSSGSIGASSIGGGLSYNPKTRKFYDISGNLVSGVSTVTLTDEQRAAKLAAEEAYERQYSKDIGGFLDDEGYATADDGKTKIKFTGNAVGGSKYSIKTASIERRKDLAGQVVKVGRETITYDDNGYAVSKKIDHNAAGTLSAPGGLSLVGERGPELRVLNSGDGIIPADATRNLWDWAAYNPKDLMSNMGSDNIFHIGNIALPNVTDAKSFVNGLKQLAYQRAYKRA